MFLDEANVAARISHPNVATVFELGRQEDTYWIAMEYLHGEPLREVMRRTDEMGATMPPEIACRVIAEAADGLHAAHELQGKDGEKLNLIHRDVTPHNLFVTYEGVTKVVDFGIAKFQDRMASTQAGTLKGKLAYMSPEQVQGENIDRRTDIFALGVVLWELTTGQRLFRMESDLDTLAKVQECNIPPPSTVIRGYPLDLEKIVMQALAKNKNDRFPTAREFSRALQSLLTRRGLFIASDEVAAYMSSIFVDRIAKREEHLRWASAVSDAAAASAPAPQATPVRAAPRAVPAQRVSVPPPVPAGAARGAPRPAAGAPARAPAAASGPRPAPASQQNTLARPAARALMPPPSESSNRDATLASQSPHGGGSYPIPAGRGAPPIQDDEDADRTVQATVAQQAAAHAAYNDFDDDNDATIVSRSAPSEDELEPPTPYGTAAPRPVIPAAGMRPPAAGDQGPLPAFQAPAPAPRPVAANARTMPLNAMSPIAPQARPAAQVRTQMGMQGPPPPAAAPVGFAERGVPSNFNIVDPSLPPTLGAGMSPGVPWGALPPPQPFAPSPQPLGPGPVQGQGQFPPFAAGGGGFGAPMYGAPPYPNAAAPAFPPSPVGTTRQVVRPMRVPAWAVAVASGVVALFLAGGIVLIYAIFFRSAPSPEPQASPGKGRATTGTASSAAAADTTNSPAAPASSGVFSAARAGFLAAATPPRLRQHTRGRGPYGGASAPPAPPNPHRAQPAPAAPTPAAQAPTPTPQAAPPPAPRPAEPAPQPPPQPRYQPRSAPANVSNAGGAHGTLSVICIPALRSGRARRPVARGIAGVQARGIGRVSPNQAREHEPSGHQSRQQDRGRRLQHRRPRIDALTETSLRRRACDRG